MLWLSTLLYVKHVANFPRCHPPCVTVLRAAQVVVAVACWLLYVPAACWCISGTDLPGQSYVLSHWDRSCRPDLLSHTLKQKLQTRFVISPGYSILTPGQPDPTLILSRKACGRETAAIPDFDKSLVWLHRKKRTMAKTESNPGLPLLRRTPYRYANEAARASRQLPTLELQGCITTGIPPPPPPPLPALHSP